MLKPHLKHLSYLLLCLGLFACNNPKPIPQLNAGIWRAELSRQDGKSVIFNFKVTDSAGQKRMIVQNADDRMRVDSIVIKGDSIFIQMPFFDSSFRAKITSKGNLEGTWTKVYSDRKEKMPFTATPNDSTRLIAYAAPNYNLSGTWETVFPNGEFSFKAIGLFKQNGKAISGTFLTPAGDFRYLQGVVSGDTLKLTGFDGGHALRFTAIATSDTTLSQGKLYSINSKVKAWEAVKKDYDQLPKAYAANYIPQGTVKFDLNLKDMRTGENVSLSDERYKGKVVVLQLLGSWCPNCLDETAYLTKYYDKNHQRGVEFIAIDFERTADYAASKKAVSSFLNRFDINYPVVFSGVAANDRDLTQKVFPGLPVDIHIFPSLIFIDKSGYVRKVHSGFNGPATGKYYEAFKTEFNGIINSLLAE